MNQRGKSVNIDLGVGPYIRFGDIPLNESSKSYSIKGSEENGVSCYECFQIDSSYRIILPPMSDRWVKAAGLLSVFLQKFLAGKINCYLINGDFVGRGSDNEPLLKNITIIKRLDIDNFKSNFLI
ncbi:MAG: hypothetical protein IKU29_11780 [Parabacteroides sp.]|nr:hypothetical protein [Parabacteroides sp.]